MREARRLRGQSWIPGSPAAPRNDEGQRKVELSKRKQYQIDVEGLLSGKQPFQLARTFWRKALAYSSRIDSQVFG
jgi:hypothetical protein